MKRRLAPRAGLILLCVFVYVSFLTSCKEEPAAPDSDDYAIYSLIIRTQFTDKGFSKIVIQQDTATVRDWTPEPEDEQKFCDAISRLLPGTQADSIGDFKAKNGEASSLANYSGLGTLIAKEQVKSFFSGTGGGWNVFYKKYPGSQGILRLSRVGFDRKRDQALLYFGNQRYWLAGAGYLVLLARKDGGWFIVKQHMLWIS